MIKTRLLKLLKGSGKYIGANIFWQWITLLFQIAAVFAAGNMIQQLFEKPILHLDLLAHQALSFHLKY